VAALLPSDEPLLVVVRRRRQEVMMFRWRLVICVLSVLSFSMCGDSNDMSPTSPSPPPDGNSVVVNIAQGAEFRSRDAFGTNPLNVSVGSTVVWQNSDGTSHDPTADGGAFNLPSIRSGGQGSFTFSSPGTFPYHCGIHPNMIGTIVVQ
jgi:plastocyanin